MATADYSLASHIGVTVVPSLLGPMVASAPRAWVVVTGLLGLAAVVMPFAIREAGAAPGHPGAMTS